MSGMKIGNSHILMGVITDGWKHIEIGNGVCINQGCHIDGRGGLSIGDNASLSVYTKIITASHNKDSDDFKYITEKVKIGKYVWTGIGATILPGAILEEGCILAAGSIAMNKKYLAYTVYGGIPAMKISQRKAPLSYDLSVWTPFFR